MRRPTLYGLIAGALLAASPLLAGSRALAAEPFKCPHTGGDFVFGQEANVNSLDQMTSSTISTRNIAMNIFETLMTRDENNKPILDLAASMDESPDHMTYTFKLRPGIKFHNGQPMTSADVAASFDRYSKVGLARSILTNVDHWDAPDPMTFVIHMKRVQPTFIDQLSSFSIPIVIFPARGQERSAAAAAHHRHRPVAAGAVRARQLREAEALCGLQAEHQLHRTHRFRRLQGGMLRHGHLPHRDRARRARGRAEDRRAAGRGGRAGQVGARAEERQGYHAAAAEELVDPDRAGEHLAAADGQPGFPPARCRRR